MTFYDKTGNRIKSKVIVVKVPFDNIVQIYDFKRKTNRIVYGPEVAILEPDESFTIVEMSGGTPKKPGVLKKIVLDLGPVFTTEMYFSFFKF